MSYLITVRTAGATRIYSDTNPGALIAALPDDEPMSITMMRQE